MSLCSFELDTLLVAAEAEGVNIALFPSGRTDVAAGVAAPAGGLLVLEV